MVKLVIIYSFLCAFLPCFIYLLMKNRKEKKFYIFFIVLFVIYLWMVYNVRCICRLLDYCSLDSLWGFSSIQTLLGFWIITNTIIVLLSTSNKCAGISSFLYMFGMTLSFYGLQAILGMFIPLFSGGFRKSLFILFTLLSIPCAIAAFVLYYWNKDNALSSLLYSLPLGALVAEIIAIFYNILQHNRFAFLFQLIMDIVGTIVFGIIFFKRVKYKKIYIVGIVLSALIFYFIFPW